MVDNTKHKIICTGNPDGFPDDHEHLKTVAHGVRIHYLKPSLFIDLMGMTYVYGTIKGETNLNN